MNGRRQAAPIRILLLFPQIGFNVGAGMSFRVSGAKLLLDARMHSFKIEDTNFNFIPITLSIVF